MSPIANRPVADAIVADGDNAYIVAKNSTDLLTLTGKSTSLTVADLSQNYEVLNSTYHQRAMNAFSNITQLKYAARSAQREYDELHQAGVQSIEEATSLYDLMPFSSDPYWRELDVLQTKACQLFSAHRPDNVPAPPSWEKSNILGGYSPCYPLPKTGEELENIILYASSAAKASGFSFFQFVTFYRDDSVFGINYNAKVGICVSGYSPHFPTGDECLNFVLPRIAFESRRKEAQEEFKNRTRHSLSDSEVRIIR